MSIDKNGNNENNKTFDDIIKEGICVMFFSRGCERKACARGLCERHYNIALRAVKQGRITWELLEKRCRAYKITKTCFDKEFGD